MMTVVMIAAMTTAAASTATFNDNEKLLVAAV
jgi:hypothetical protein